VSPQRAAELQVVLEGVALPAKKQQLLDYARTQDAAAVSDLEALPDREYSSLDEVGEALAPVQPSRAQSLLQHAHEESGDPPGGGSYTDPHPEPGSLRPSIPPTNPPQKTLEKQAETQKRQQKRQQERGVGE
jgi:hypothetical protein